LKGSDINEEAFSPFAKRLIDQPIILTELAEIVNLFVRIFI